MWERSSAPSFWRRSTPPPSPRQIHLISAANGLAIVENGTYDASAVLTAADYLEVDETAEQLEANLRTLNRHKREAGGGRAERGSVAWAVWFRWWGG